LVWRDCKDTKLYKKSFLISVLALLNRNCNTIATIKSAEKIVSIKEDQAIINRMGFNNGGVEAVVKRLKKK
jgi:dihydroorotate dehydrogenase